MEETVTEPVDVTDIVLVTSTVTVAIAATVTLPEEATDSVRV